MTKRDACNFDQNQSGKRFVFMYAAQQVETKTNWCHYKNAHIEHRLAMGLVTYMAGVCLFRTRVPSIAALFLYQYIIINMSGRPMARRVRSARLFLITPRSTDMNALRRTRINHFPRALAISTGSDCDRRPCVLCKLQLTRR